MEQGTSKLKRTSETNSVLTIVVAVTLLLAAVAAFLSSTRETQEYSATSPERAVQKYLQAIIDGRYESASNYLSQRSPCDATDIDRSWMPESVRVNLKNSSIEGANAFITVNVDLSSGGPFDDYYTESHNFRLSMENGEWKILGIPWPMYSCDEVKS